MPFEFQLGPTQPIPIEYLPQTYSPAFGDRFSLQRKIQLDWPQVSIVAIFVGKRDSSRVPVGITNVSGDDVPVKSEDPK